MNINLNLYKYFYEVAKYNSYTKAASALMISQPSLSYSIKVLENQLGKKLFVRHNNKINLTEDGAIIFKKLTVIFEQLNEISCDNEKINGKLILGVRSAYANRVLPFYINEINKIYPDLEIEFIIATSNKLLNFLNDKVIDILIDEYELNDNYNSILHYEDKMVFFTTKENYNTIKGIKFDEQYLTNNKVCIVKRNNITKEVVDRYPSFNYLFYQSTPLMLAKIYSDNLIGISPLSVIREELISGKLVEIKSEVSLPKAVMYISYKKRLENKKIRAVVNFFNEHNFL